MKNSDIPAIEGGTPVRDTVLPYATQWIRNEEIQAVVEVLKSGWLTSGPKIPEFESALAEVAGAKHAVAVNSGTASLAVSAAAIGLGPDDEAVVPSLTFAATAFAVLYTGANLVLADISEDTYNIDPAEIERKITPKTKAVLPVHYAGNPCDMDAVTRIAREHDLSIIEDAAHAIGASWKGTPIGAIGDLTCHSFHAIKNVTCGEGGAVTTDSDELRKRLTSLRYFGLSADTWQRARTDRPWLYHIEELGFKCNMMDIQAALGIVQLKRIDEFKKRRAEIVDTYNKAFAAEEAIITPTVTDGAESALHLYVIRLRPETLRADRDQALRALHAENIRANIHYLPLHLHPYFQRAFDFKRGDFPVTERVADNIITIPLFPKMTDADTRSVIDALTRIIDYYRA